MLRVSRMAHFGRGAYMEQLSIEAAVFELNS
jgi:hypothetical protein